MSAWIVSHHHVNLILSAAIERGFTARLAPDGPTLAVSAATAAAFGHMLLEENIRSVAHRYGYEGTARHQDALAPLADYAFHALLCYDYQACEAPGYDTSPAGTFARELLDITFHEPFDAEDDRWGYDTEAQVRAVCDSGPLS